MKEKGLIGHVEYVNTKGMVIVRGRREGTEVEVDREEGTGPHCSSRS
jgi:hypothetical protein